MKKALVRHDEILKKAIEENGGFVFKTVGDAFCAAFDTAMEGLKAALAAQLAVNASTWETPVPIRVRMALHTGEAIERDRDYYGPALNRVARLDAIGHGGQTLISLVSAELVRDMLPENVELKDLGARRLKDLTRAESVFQLRHPDLPDDFPPLKSLDMHPHNLPMQPTPLIGREKELERLGKLLEDAAARIVTLTGPGGMGKTRLALQVAADQIERFEDGAFFIDLAPVTEAELMISVLAQTLHVKEMGNRTLIDIVKEFLCSKKMLLLLDNFEQIMDAALQVVELLGSCPGVKFLVTSREALHLRGEKVFTVPPLTLPEPISKETVEIESITQYEAVRLFIERATAVRQDFQVNNENAPAVAEICVRLDGIPLAIELAAARIRLLSPQAILSRLDHRLKLLTGGARDLPNRQKTLRATIDWSYELLDEPCRELFRTLAVFVGGFTLEAVEAVCAGEIFAEREILDGIESLVDKSLVFLEERATADSDGEPRFHLLETIREFALEQLAESGEKDAVRNRHAAYLLELAERAEPELERRKQKYWLNRLEREHENLRAAFTWLHGQERREESIRLAGSLWYFWQTRWYFSEGRKWLTQALENTTSEGDAFSAKAMLGAGSLAYHQGDYEKAEQQLLRSYEAFRGFEDMRGVAQACREIGRMYMSMDDYGEARRFFDEGIELSKRIHAEELRSGLILNLGLINWREGDLATAKEQFEESRSIFVQKGDRKRESEALSNLGIIQYEQGDFQSATNYFNSSLKIQKEIGDLNNMGNVLNNLGYLYYRLEDMQSSRKYYEELAELVKNTGDRRMKSTAYAGLADTYLASGEPETALEWATRAMEEIEQQGTGVELAVSLRVLGDVHLEMGDLDRAKKYFEQSIPLLEKAKESEDLERARNGLARIRSNKGRG